MTAPSPAPRQARPRCAVQVDVDSFGTLLRYYGHTDGVPPEPFFDAAMPRLLELFEGRGIRATFFVVGDDLRGAAGGWLGRLHAAGHEIASHTQHHPFAFTRLAPEEQEAELEAAERAIGERIGVPPVGFRSPGYDVDERLLRLLQQRGYAYDSSVFPSIMAPALRVAQALIRLGRPARHGTLGRLALLLAPRTPYRPASRRLWRRGGMRIAELPVGTLPGSRAPFYGTVHVAAGWPAFAATVPLLGRGDLVYAMHAVDVVGPDRDPIDPRLQVHPGLRVPSRQKTALFARIFHRLERTYEFVTSKELALGAAGAQP